MSSFIPEIKPKIGLNNILFGIAKVEAELILGNAEEHERFDSGDDYQTEVLHYWSSGFSLFFDQRNNYILSCVEIDNEDTLLWGEKIFSLTEEQIVELFVKQGYIQKDMEEHDWGERRLSFEGAMVDFYFESNELISISFGVQETIGSDDIYIFPN
jgi:hypothetical protein